MQVNITFRGMESTDSLKNFTQERVAHVNRYLDKAAEATVVLSLERYLHHADVTIYAGPYVLRGKYKGDDMYRSIEQAVERIERQARRYKSKMKTLKHRGATPRDATELKMKHNIFEAPDADGALEAEAEAWTQGPKVILTNELVARPMTVEEAVMEMDLLNSAVLVFSDVGTGVVNVLYRREDGHFGLIETSAAARATGG